MHIPVKSYDSLSEREPDTLLLFAWNHASEIMDKEQEFRARDGKWIMYVPEVGIIQ